MREKKPKLRAAQPPAPIQKLGVMFHFRRCHLCDGLTEKEDDLITHCAHCGKSLAPFYFFDDSKVAPVSDVDLDKPVVAGQRLAIRGLTAHWSS